MSTQRWFLTSSLLVLAPATTFAGTLFSDSFTTDLPNTSTALSDATAANHPVLDSLDIGKKWMVRTPSTTGTSNPIVSRQYAVQVRSDDPVEPGNNFLSLYRNTVSTPVGSGGVFGYAHAQLSDADTAANVGRTITTSFKLYIGNADTGATPTVNGTTGELFRLVGHPSNTVGEYANNGDLSAGAFTNGTFSTRFYKTGATGFQTQGLVTPGDPTPVPTFRYDEWNTITVVTDLSAATPFFQLTVVNTLGTMTSARQKIWTAAGTTVGTVQFTVFNDSLTKIDDVLITNDIVAAIPGDFDNDGDRDAADIDLLFAAAEGTVPPALSKFDLNNDGVVNTVVRSTGSDANVWVETLKDTAYGDITLDGAVNFDDLLILAQSYGSPTAGWASGNVDGRDGVGFGDLLLLAQNYGQGSLISSSEFAQDWALAQSLVPEPTSCTAFLLLLGSARRHRSRSHD